MVLKTRRVFLCAALAVASLWPSSARAGRIVVANDEWTLSDTGFFRDGVNDPGVFATNVASWFTGGGLGRFHAYSTNFGLTETNFRNAMVSAGHSFTTGLGITFDVATLLTYDGIFVAGDGADNQVLAEYVLAGGNVYLAGGTGIDGPVAEAARWNNFLNRFGLALYPGYNALFGSLPIVSSHPIFVGVDSLYQANGNSVLAFGPDSQVLVSFRGEGLYAVYSPSDPDPDPDPDPIPEPGTLLLGAVGLALVARFAWKARRQE